MYCLELCEVVRGGNESFNVPKDVRVVLTDRFQAFKPVVLSTGVAAQLVKRGIDADKLRQRQCPTGWEFAYGDLPSDVEFGKRDGSFSSARRNDANCSVRLLDRKIGSIS